jgi:predicted nuclease of predicted toxin-antitoxin system
MKLFATLYLDEDVPILLAALLQGRGMDVTTAQVQQRLGRSDEAQLAYAASQERCLLTHNRVDFEHLHAEYITQGKQHAGILIARRRQVYQLADRVMVLLNSRTADEIGGHLWYV